MSAPSKQALNAAYIAHVTKLFNVLMSEPTEESYQRFKKGMKASLEMYQRTEREMESWNDSI